MRAHDTVLEFENLQVEFETRRGRAVAVDGVSLAIQSGEIFGLVGESGSGKSTLALSVLRLIDPPGRIVSGRIELRGQNLLDLSPAEMQQIRGKRVSMILQDPASTLNPVLRIGEQITEVLSYHGGGRGRAAITRAAELLDLVGISSPPRRLDQYPHQLSGGMQQRVVIAIALALEPELLLADEPTSALDVTIQADILDLIEVLQQQTAMATMLITHDFGVVARLCSRVAVMYAGKIVEIGSVGDVLARPAHPYTVGLIGAAPRLGGRGERLRPVPGVPPNLVHPPDGCRFHPRCAHTMEICRRVEPPLLQLGATKTVACHLYPGSLVAQTGVLVAAEPAWPDVQGATAPEPSAESAMPLLRVTELTKDFPAGGRWQGGIRRRLSLRAVDGVSFDIGSGEALGLVGESGSGKSTIARLVMRLHEPTSGRILLDGTDLTELRPTELVERRRLFQIVFQNPYTSLDPRWTVERLIGEPLDVHEALTRADRGERILGLLTSVSLDRVHLHRYPHQLSGGQRQRAALARALALNTRLLVADEPLSSLDVSIQAQILELLSRLKDELGLSLLFITHDLAVAERLCERVAVLYAGQIVEVGRTEEVLRNPRHPYTQTLLSSVLSPSVGGRPRRIRAGGEPPTLFESPSNCPFHTRCPHALPICRTLRPPEVSVGNGRVARCHLVASEEL